MASHSYTSVTCKNLRLISIGYSDLTLKSSNTLPAQAMPEGKRASCEINRGMNE